jgi:hypothetical protein
VEYPPPSEGLRAVKSPGFTALPIATQTLLRASSHGCAGFWGLVMAHRTGAAADRADSTPRLRQPPCRTMVALEGILAPS